MVKVYYIDGVGCTHKPYDELGELEDRLRREIIKNPKTEKIETIKKEITDYKNGIKGYDSKRVCIKGSLQNIVSVYLKGGFVYSQDSIKQLNYLVEHIKEVSSHEFCLIVGFSYGGMVANKLHEMLEKSSVSNYTIITINSIQRIYSSKIVNYMHIGDVALKTDWSKGFSPPPVYSSLLNTLITKDSKSIFRYRDILDGNTIWYCYPTREGICRYNRYNSHTSILDWRSHRHDPSVIVDLLLTLNGEIDDYFDSNIITLMPKINDFLNDFSNHFSNDFSYEVLDRYKIVTLKEKTRKNIGGKKRKMNRSNSKIK